MPPKCRDGRVPEGKNGRCVKPCNQLGNPHLSKRCIAKGQTKRALSQREIDAHLKNLNEEAEMIYLVKELKKAQAEVKKSIGGVKEVVSDLKDVFKGKKSMPKMSEKGKEKMPDFESMRIGKKTRELKMATSRIEKSLDFVEEKLKKKSVGKATKNNVFHDIPETDEFQDPRDLSVETQTLTKQTLAQPATTPIEFHDPLERSSLTTVHKMMKNKKRKERSLFKDIGETPTVSTKPDKFQDISEHTMPIGQGKTARNTKRKARKFKDIGETPGGASGPKFYDIGEKPAKGRKFKEFRK